MSHSIRILIGVFAVAFVAQGASAQFVCEKVGKNGNAKYKIRSE